MATKKLMTRDERIEILISQHGPLCFLPDCRKPFKARDEITFDHWWIPQSKGGTWDIENLRLMHKRCNALKGDRVPSPDGTLPELKREPNSAARRHARRSVRVEVCLTCDSGRKLGPEDECLVCGSFAMPRSYPRWAKMKPSECTHEFPFWCFMEALEPGLRRPAIYDVLDGESSLDGQ